MSNLVNGVTQQQSLTLQGRPSHGLPLVGQHKGESLILNSNAQSLLASAAEEMSFMRAEKKTQDFSKRKISDREQLSAGAADQVKKYLDNAKDLDKQKHLFPFFSALQKQSTLSPAQLAAKHFQDISQQYIALAFARDELNKLRKTSKSKNIDNLLASVESSLSALLGASGPEINAGINVSTMAMGHNETGLDTVNNLRQFYRDSVLDYGGLSKTFQKIINEYCDQQIAESIKYLINALGADISSEGPSIPKKRLQMIVDDIYKLQALQSIHEECDELLLQLSRIFNATGIPNNQALMQELLSLLEKKWITPELIIKLVINLQVSDEEMTIYFLRGFKELARSIPLKAYDDPYERDKLITVIQEALDQCIEEEEISQEGT
jgi:type III secretion protein W